MVDVLTVNFSPDATTVCLDRLLPSSVGCGTRPFLPPSLTVSPDRPLPFIPPVPLPPRLETPWSA